VGVLAATRGTGSWEEGGGVIDEVVGGAGEVNLAGSSEEAFWNSGEPGIEGERSLGGVVGCGSSVDGMRTSWENGACRSILPGQLLQVVQAASDTSET
jgi:hypothetical protein